MYPNQEDSFGFFRIHVVAISSGLVEIADGVESAGSQRNHGNINTTNT